MNNRIPPLLCLFLIVFSLYCPSLADSDANIDLEIPLLSESDHITVVLEEFGVIGRADMGLEMERPVTRAEALDVIAKFMKLEFADDHISPKFKDIKGHWSEQLVMNFYEAGLVNGMTKNTFEPNRLVYGQEFLKILLSTMGYEIKSLEHAEALADEIGLTQDGYVLRSLSPNAYPFRRSDACRMCYSAFFATAPEGEPLYRRFINDGVYDEEVLLNRLELADSTDD